MAVVVLLTSLLTLALPVVVVVVVVRQAGARGAGASGDAHGVRRFFQYLLLLALTVVVATGVWGLLAEPFRRPSAVDTAGALARAIAFVVVGAPILWLLAAWTRRLARHDPAELAGLGWAAYVTLVQLAAVAVAAVGAHDVARAALVEGRLDAPAAVAVLVWGALWWIAHLLDVRTLDGPRRRPLLLLGSLVGWVLSMLGLVWLLGAALAAFVLPTPAVIVGATSPIGEAAAALASGLPIWVWYWRHRLARTEVDGWWLAYVLPLGVGASLVIAVTGVSIVADRVLVRVLGESSGTAAEYAAGTSTAVGLAVVGALSWWYHRQVMALRGPAQRTELVRVVDYLLAGIALVAAAVGIALAVVALLEALAPTAAILVGEPVVNLVLAAVTLLLVSGPLWWVFWSRIRRVRAAEPTVEVASPTRRVYLLVLFGVAGVVAVAVLLVAAFLVLDDLLAGHLGAGTVADVRVPVGMLAASATISAYHWAVYREDRRIRPAAAPPRRGPSQVLLVGPADEMLVAELRRATGARVEAWVTGPGEWDRPAVLAAVTGSGRQQAVVLATAGGPQLVEAGSAAGSEERRDQPGPGREQGEPQLGQHPQTGGFEGQQRGAAGGSAVAEP
jgi:hypothetical protein